MTSTKIKKQKLIGGFFELTLPTHASKKNILNHWGLSTNTVWPFSNARSALSALLFAIKLKKKAWLPAYSCASLVDPFTINHIPISYYAVGDTLEPDVLQLNSECQAGDIVLGINYFGQAPSKLFRDFTKRRNDLIFIEDCAQTIDTENIAWGDWRLISPRKVIGVADGGFIIPRQSTSRYSPLPPKKQNLDMNDWFAFLSRFEDPANNKFWHPINQKYEKKMSINNRGMSRLSFELLKNTDAPSIIKKRKQNFIALHKRLFKSAFLQTKTPNFCPFGFPIRLQSNLRDFLKNELIKIGVFSAIHWTLLPSPRAAFKKEHRLSNELLTLPCDQRYNIADMEYIADNVLKILRKKK